MKRTLITVVALLLASVDKSIAQQAPSALTVEQSNLANADISDLVIEDDLRQLRMLANANATKAAAKAKGGSSGGGGGGGDGEGGDEGEDDGHGAPDEKAATGDEEDELAHKQGAPELSEEQLEAADDAADAKTTNDFTKKGLDTTEDFTDEMFKAVASKGPKYIKRIKRYGAVMELLEPRARTFVNVPQARNPARRKNCGITSDARAHFLTTQGSKNYIQWRTKRVAKEGNCTIKVSNDAKTYFPVTPVGMKSNFFPCGRKVGYEAVQIKLPKQMVSSEHGPDFIILQFEMYSYMGTIVQCGDMIVEKARSFHVEKCDPQCKNGGVCQEGKCKCGSNYYGDYCEHKGGSSGAFSLLIFIFVIALVAAAVGLLYVRYNMQKEQANTAAEEANEGGNREHTSRGFLKKRGFNHMDESLREEN